MWRRRWTPASYDNDSFAVEQRRAHDHALQNRTQVLGKNWEKSFQAVGDKLNGDRRQN